MRISTFRRFTRLAIALAFSAIVFAQETYKKPPQAILDVLNAPQPPTISVSPSKDAMLMSVQPSYPSIADLAQPMLRLAGLRINPSANGPYRAPYSISMTLKRIPDGTELKVALPPNAKAGVPRWSPDGRQFAFTNTLSNGIELWIGDASTGETRKMSNVSVNAVYGEPFQWVDNRRILVQTVPPGRGKSPEKPVVPVGPIVQETSGRAGPVRTYQDLLEDAYDERIFEYYAASALVFVDPATGQTTPIGKPGIFQSVDVSPDGEYLLVASIHRPFSYLHPVNLFPRLIEVWDKTGKPVYRLADQPLADSVPIGGVRMGSRSFQWQPTAPHTLVWVEALDDGDPDKKVTHRDRILTLSAPFAAPPTELHRTEHRFTGLSWFERDPVILVTDNDRTRRWTRTMLLSLDKSAPPREIWSRSAQDRYNDPGSAVTRTLPNGRSVVAQHGDFIFLAGQGASPQGDLPFLDRFNIRTLQSERIFRSAQGTYETFVTLVSSDGSQFLTRKETPIEPPNYFLRRADGGTPLALTRFADPAPILRKIKKQLVTYTRQDGVPLSFTLYLPPDYREGTRLPTLLWAYPTEFTDPSTAAQVSGSTARFTTLSGASELFFVLQGYAVLHNAAMPVIGPPDVVNNTYVEQITMNAKAAIEKAAAMGVTDPKRVGVGGHSYGAFMTANLLAHTDLFRAGIARSGAYNRTLTPFGFQNEERTLWEAPETYLKMSPFMYADKLKEPILFIHGEADDNAGTFLIQSERMFQAVSGHGGAARLVTLPYEAHGYAAKESIEHTLHEMLAWFERWVRDVR